MRNRFGRRRQEGVSIVAILLAGVIIVVLAILGMRLVPPVIEYFTIQSVVKRVKSEGATVRDIRTAFDRNASLENISSITGKDLEITKEGEQVVISFEYSHSVPLLENVRIVIDFSGSTSDRPAKAAP